MQIILELLLCKAILSPTNWYYKISNEAYKNNRYKTKKHMYFTQTKNQFSHIFVIK